MKLYTRPHGGRDAETVIAEASAADGVYWDYDRSEPEGPNAMLLTLPGSRSDEYVLEVESSEVGVMIGEMNLPDVRSVMASFLARASPEVIGAVAGQIITHVARVARTPSN